MKFIATTALAFLAIGCSSTQQSYLGLADAQAIPYVAGRTLPAPFETYGEISNVSHVSYQVYLGEKQKGNVLLEQRTGEWIYFCTEITVEIVPTKQSWVILERHKTKPLPNQPDARDGL